MTVHVLNYYNDHIPVFLCILIVCKRNFDPTLIAGFIHCLYREVDDGPQQIRDAPVPPVVKK